MSDGNHESICYIAVGDSLTEGIGADDLEQHWTARHFSELKKTPQCRLRNLGISGMTSVELLQLVSNPALARFMSRATHISITTGGCDFLQLYHEHGYVRSAFIEKMDEVRGVATQILTTLRKQNELAKIYLFGFYVPRPAYEIAADEAIISIQKMNKYYKSLCQKVPAVLIDPFDTFLNRHDYFHDEVHPNQQGYDKLTSLFMDMVL